MVGTPNFLAPEIATRKTHSFEADIWSLGALIYQCLVGKPPFDDQGGIELNLDSERRIEMI